MRNHPNALKARTRKTFQMFHKRKLDVVNGALEDRASKIIQVNGNYPSPLLYNMNYGIVQLSHMYVCFPL